MKLIFPPEVLDQHVVTLGKTGAGKSSALRHVVEWLLDHDKRVCVIDPKGDWWGLKSSSDGRGEGYPVIAFGDFKNAEASDVPLNQHSGAHVAELVATGNRPAMIGFRGWMTSHMVQFWIEFAAGIFNQNVGELYLVVDECHNFAPKGKIMDPQAGKCLHWSNRLLSEGRGLGIVCLLASQRPQKVHNDTLTSCETLIAMRVIHAADRSAVEDWIDGAGDAKLGKEVLANLAQMPRGDAYIWSPEIGYGPTRITFPMFETFDSFAPPQLQKKVARTGWADVDLDEVREKMSAVIEEHRANDPKELRKEIHDLKRQLHQLEGRTKEQVREVPVEVPIIKDGQIERIETIESKLGVLGRDLIESVKELTSTLNSAKVAKLHPLNRKAFETINRAAFRETAPKQAAPRGKVEPARRETAPTDGISNSQQKILDEMAHLLALRVERPTVKQIAVFCGVSHTTGSFLQNLRDLDRDGYIERASGTARLTGKGLQYANAPQSRGSIAEMWKAKLDGAKAKMLDVIIRQERLSKGELAEHLGVSPSTGSFLQNIRDLRSYGIIEVESGVIEPSEILLLG